MPEALITREANAWPRTAPSTSSLGDLADQLGPDRIGKCVKSLGDDVERARTADDTVPIVKVQIALRRQAPARRRTIIDDWQAIDDDAGLKGVATRLREVASIIVCAVAGNVDHAPSAAKGTNLEELHGE